MKYWAFIFLSCLTEILNAQISLPSCIDTTSSNFSISFRSSHDIQSSSLNNGLFLKLLRGGVIDDDLIQANLAKQKGINRIGREFTNELHVITPFQRFSEFKKLKNYAVLYEAGYTSLFSGNYSNDLFDLIFKGNVGFLGDTADFSGTSFQYLDFQNIGIGLSHKKTASSFSLNVVNVQNYLSTSFSRATIFFAADSSQLDMNLRADLKQSFSKKFNKGVGLALNFNINIEVPWINDSTAFFQFNVKNFGFAKTNKLVQYQIDTNLTYNGFQLDDLLNLNYDLFKNEQWQDTFNIRKDTISIWMLLPAMIQFGKIINMNTDKKIQSFFGIKMYPTIKYVPKIYLGLDFFLQKKIHIGLTSAYGGFGNLRFGCYSNFTTKKLNVGLGTEDLYGLISKKGFGQMLSVNFKFNL